MSQAAATSLPWSMAWLLARANLQREPLLRFAFPLLFSFPFFPSHLPFPFPFPSLLFPSPFSSLIFLVFLLLLYLSQVPNCCSSPFLPLPGLLLSTGLRGQGTSFGFPGRSAPSLHLPIHRGPIRAAWRGRWRMGGSL